MRGVGVSVHVKLSSVIAQGSSGRNHQSIVPLLHVNAPVHAIIPVVLLHKVHSTCTVVCLLHVESGKAHTTLRWSLGVWRVEERMEEQDGDLGRV